MVGNDIYDYLVSQWLGNADDISSSVVSAKLAGLVEPIVLNGGDEGKVVVEGPVNVIPSRASLDTGTEDGSVDLVVHVCSSIVTRLIKGDDVESIFIEVAILEDLSEVLLDILGTISNVGIVHIVHQVRDKVDILRQLLVLEVNKELISVEEVIATSRVVVDIGERDEREVLANVRVRD